MTSQGVETLGYELVLLDNRHDFAQAGVWSGDLGSFKCRLEGGWLEARPQADFADVDGAKQALDPHLRAWALRAELEDNIQMEFKFRSAQGPSGTQVMADSAIGVGEALDVAIGHISYPRPHQEPS